MVCHSNCYFVIVNTQQTSKKLLLVRLLMLISQLLLLVFVCYWLWSEYHSEKGLLKDQLTAKLEDARRQVADSIIKKKFLFPLIIEAEDDFNEGLGYDVFPKDTLYSTAVSGSHTYGTYNFDSLPVAFKNIQKVIGETDPKKTKINITQTFRVKNDIQEKKEVVRDSSDQKVIFQLRPDESQKAFDSIKSDRLLTGVFKIVASQLIEDSIVNLKKEVLAGDSTLTKNKFQYIIDSEGWTFVTKWETIDTLTPDKKSIILQFDEDREINISGYNGYLFKEIMPQTLFALLLMAITAIAFIFTYRSLSNQIKLSELKNGLISNISHELKTPVSTVKVALEAINNFDVVNHPEKTREYVQIAMLETHRLELLVNKALNTSLMEQGKMTLQRQQANIYELVADIVAALRLRLKQNGADITLKTEGENFNINVDKLHVQGAVMNIIDNSIKYGNEPVNIDITVSATDAAIAIEIADNGPGIPEEYSSQVFDKFFRVPSGDQHDVKGYGLGLSYVRQVMQMHDGYAEMKNKAAGGCKFTLKFYRGR